LTVPARATAKELAAMISRWRLGGAALIVRPAQIPVAQTVTVEDGIAKIEVNDAIIAVAPW
jgi:hypothetical protein